MAKANTNPNMELWNKYAEPPKEATRPFNNGSFNGTDISPMWRIRCLTEEYGACGIGWYDEIVEHWTETVEGIPMVFMTIKLFVRDKVTGEWSAPIQGIGGNSFVRKAGGKPSDEAYKMVHTDALGSACKMLGIGGKVYWEKGYSKYEDDYVDDSAPRQTAKRAPAKAPAPMPEEAAPAFMPVSMPEAPEPDTASEEETFRRRALMRFSKASLDKSCMANFGTTFDDTPYATLREVPVLKKIGGVA